MASDDFSNYEFVPCEVCDTMIRFSDYTQHIEECENRMRQPLYRFIPFNAIPNIPATTTQALLQQLRSLNNSNVVAPLDNAPDGEESASEDDTDNTTTPISPMPMMDLSAFFEPLLPLNIPHSDQNIPAAGENDAVQDVEQDTSFESNFQNNPFFNMPLLNALSNLPPLTPMNFTLETVQNDPLAVLESNLAMVNELLRTPLNMRQEQNHSTGEEQEDQTNIQEGEGEIDERRSLDSPAQVFNTFRQRIQHILNNNNIVNPQENQPLLPNNDTLNSNNGRLLFQLTRYYPMPGQDMSDYDFNILLGNLIGKVERGIENIDDVSQIVTDYSDDSVCPVCQESFKDLPEIPKRKLLCNHMFCDTCISKWLEKNIKCPVCMSELDQLMSQRKVKED
jgi:hypothetical protein